MGSCVSSLLCLRGQQKQEVQVQDNKNLNAQQANANLDDNNNNNNEAITGEEKTLFFDARQSFSDVVQELPYAPAMTMKGGVANNVTIDDPSTLLQHPPIIPEEPEQQEVIVDAASSAVSASTRLVQQELQTGMPGVQIIRKGYPGELTQDELDVCLEFRSQLRQRDATGETAYSEMVHCYNGPEEEAFALCRFLRARQFVIKDTFAMMEKNVDMWKGARKEHIQLKNPRRHIQNAIGCPLPVFWNQFPIVDTGVAKNGAYVVYFLPGYIHVDDGLECIQPNVLDFMPIVWYLFAHDFKNCMLRIKNEHDVTKTTVLAEAVIIIDLKDMSRSLFTKDVMEFLKQAFVILGSFPEILNRLVIINVPTYFTMIWAILKLMIDPRTVKKVGFFSSTAHAEKDILKLVEPEELLSDYGGTALSFDEAWARQLRLDGEYNRYVIERLTTTGGRKNNKHKKKDDRTNTTAYQLPVVELKENESATITVYTQSTKGANFRLMTDQLETATTTQDIPRKMVKEAMVRNKRGTNSEEVAASSNRGTNPQMTEVASNIPGPRKLMLEASPVEPSSSSSSSSSDKDHYLVVVAIK